MAITIGTDKAYTLKADRQSESPSVFTLKTLSLMERAKLGQLCAEVRDLADQDNPERIMEISLSICRIGVVSVQGVVDADGREVNVEPQDIERIADPDIIGELLQAVLEHNQMGKEEEKNSPRPPTPGWPEKTAETAPGPGKAGRKQKHAKRIRP